MTPSNEVGTPETSKHGSIDSLFESLRYTVGCEITRLEARAILAESRLAEVERERDEADAAAKRWYAAGSPYATPGALREALISAEKVAEQHLALKSQLGLTAEQGVMAHYIAPLKSQLSLAESSLSAAVDAAIERAIEIVAKHRRHIEAFPGAGKDSVSYGLATCDDITSDLSALKESKP